MCNMTVNIIILIILYYWKSINLWIFHFNLFCSPFVVLSSHDFVSLYPYGIYIYIYMCLPIKCNQVWASFLLTSLPVRCQFNGTCFILGAVVTEHPHASSRKTYHTGRYGDFIYLRSNHNSCFKDYKQLFWHYNALHKVMNPLAAFAQYNLGIIVIISLKDC